MQNVVFHHLPSDWHALSSSSASPAGNKFFLSTDKAAQSSNVVIKFSSRIFKLFSINFILFFFVNSSLTTSATRESNVHLDDDGCCDDDGCSDDDDGCCCDDDIVLLFLVVDYKQFSEKSTNLLNKKIYPVSDIDICCLWIHLVFTAY